MPEGHSIYRYARHHHELLVGRDIAASSPQGRFRGGAARINGRRLLEVDAHGKHLFYHWRRAETLHIHLGLYGKFRVFHTDPPPPTPATRLVLSTDDTSIYLSGPTVCELIEPTREAEIRARLGPDPLQAGNDGHTATLFVANLATRRIPIGAAIIDQSVIAGLGNIYRAEALFLTGINPQLPANDVPEHKVIELWNTSVDLLERGVTDGKIETVPGTPRRRDHTDNRLYVYQRDRFRCRKCGGSIAHGQLAGRTIWWCPACQTGGKQLGNR